jgi:pyruvate formate-lyase/glycerol dehydratase family glycyl radical enzyme
VISVFKGRVGELREKQRIPELCIERAGLLTESYKATEGETAVIRQAKALEKVLKGITISIADDELIVGRATSKPVAGILTPEVQWQWYEEELNNISKRKAEILQPLSESEMIKLKEITSYWRGKSLFDKWYARLPEKLRDKHQWYLWGPVISGSPFHLAHNCPGIDKVINRGTNGITDQIKSRLEKLDIANLKDYDEYTFLTAANIALQAVSVFGKRHAVQAKLLAENEPDSRRKAELLRIAETCNWVPANPARSFYEAMQSLWFVYIALMLEGWGPGIGFGRLDQYLYPFYKKDIEEGRITRENARELIGLFYIKLNELVMPFSSNASGGSTGSGQLPLSGITLGGVTPQGKDAINELSYLFLEAEEDVMLQEDLTVRVNSKTPEAFLMKACEVAKLARGKIKFTSDETVIQQLISDGKPIEYARDYGITGCFIHTVPGRSLDTGGDFINLPIMLELALNNGVSRIANEQLGPKTGDPRNFKTYDEVLNAYKKQVEAMVRARVISSNISRQCFAEFLPTPFQSALYDGCIEKGMDITKGGTFPYLTQGWWVCGIPNVGDSLAVIKRLVFEERVITMDMLITALDNNFCGKDEILKEINSVPKFGNDDDYVDSITNDVLIHLRNELDKYRGYGGIKFTIAAGCVASYTTFGKITGALPDGRKAGEPLSEGGISPYQGRDVNGPTSTMRSVAKLDLTKASGGAVLNMRFNPDGLNDQSKMKKFVSLLRIFCQTGGDLVQFNIVSSEMLRDAQKHPEKYKDLLVRVATYSAYFVELPQELQNDIIARTEFQRI